MIYTIYLALFGAVVICDTIVFAVQKKHINDLEKEVRELRRMK